MNLTTLAAVRQWVGSQTGTDDALLQRLIGEASQTALNYMQRKDIALQTVTEIQSGKGTSKLQLRNWPVVAVNSLIIDTQAIPQAANSSAYGYFLEQNYGSIASQPQFIAMSGVNCAGVGAFPNGQGVTAYRQDNYASGRPFTRGVGNVTINYTFGYAIQGEAQTIPSALTIVPNQPSGSFLQDLGVQFASNGTALTPVSSSPTTGQYIPPSVSGDTPTLVYTFAAADVGKAVLLNYNFVPYDMEQAVIELVGERYRYRGRIGEASRTLGGQETASYMVKDPFTASIKTRLEAYKIGWDVR